MCKILPHVKARRKWLCYGIVGLGQPSSPDWQEGSPAASDSWFQTPQLQGWTSRVNCRTPVDRSCWQGASLAGVIPTHVVVPDPCRWGRLALATLSSPGWALRWVFCTFNSSPFLHKLSRRESSYCQSPKAHFRVQRTLPAAQR